MGGIERSCPFFMKNYLLFKLELELMGIDTFDKDKSIKDLYKKYMENSNDYRKYSGYVPTEAKEHTSFVKSALASDFKNPLRIGSIVKKGLDARYPGTNFASTLWNGGLLALESVTYAVQGIFGPTMGIEN